MDSGGEGKEKLGALFQEDFQRDVMSQTPSKQSWSGLGSVNLRAARTVCFSSYVCVEGCVKETGSSPFFSPPTD